MKVLTTVVQLGLCLASAAAASAATVDGAAIHWTSYGGRGETIVLVHGWTCDESSWREQVEVVSRNHRVITLDLPGHGKSGMPKGPFTMELFARAVEAVRVDAKADRVFLVGHSMGTPVIREYALMYPDRVKGLVLVDGLVQVPTAPVQAGQAGRGPLPVVTGAARKNMIKGMFGPATTPSLQQHILKMMLSTAEATAAGAMTATWDQSQWSDQKVTAPVLAVYAGTRPLATEQAVKSMYPAAQYFTIPETAHFLMMEKPVEFNRMLLEFVGRHK